MSLGFYRGSFASIMCISLSKNIMALVQTVLTAAAVTGAAFGSNDTLNTCVIYGTWDGATATLEISPDDGTTWIVVDAINATLTANGAFDFMAAAGFLYRIAISGAGAGTSLSSKVSQQNGNS